MTALVDTPLPVRPSVGFLLAHPAHFIALGFGSGLSPLAPGTVGTLWAWLTWALLQMLLTPLGLGLVILAAFVVGWWACAVTATHLRSPDPGSIVWDEVIAFWLVLWLVTPASFGAQLTAFVLFRVLDAWKPGPIAWADSIFVGFGWRAGFGVLFDDLVAAFCTLLLIALGRQLW